jgi:hypothetical protein
VPCATRISLSITSLDCTNHFHFLHPWEDVSMDFISGFPLTLQKHDCFCCSMLFFQRWPYSCLVTSILLHNRTTNLFFHHVWTTFGLPCTITSNRDAHFLSHFWKALWKMLHPQTDGQIEVVNCTLVQPLHNLFQE